MRLGYLGPRGTFSEEALVASAALAGAVPGDQRVALPTVHAVVVAVQEGEVDRGLVPLENSLEGSVNEAVDALVHDAPDVRIVGETVIPVRYCLVARPGVSLEDVEVVLSHPQALAQCATALRALLPHAGVQATTSTAEAVKAVVEREGSHAALGTHLAAELYGATVLREGLEHDAPNVTRFVWLARHGVAGGERSRSWKSSVVFSGDGDGRPGWLVRCLSEFAFRGVNLTRIESRPARQRLGHYVFLVDLEGRADVGGPAAEAVAALRDHCDVVRLLGSYPVAVPERRPERVRTGT